MQVCSEFISWIYTPAVFTASDSATVSPHDGPVLEELSKLCVKPQTASKNRIYFIRRPAQTRSNLDEQAEANAILAESLRALHTAN